MIYDIPYTEKNIFQQNRKERFSFWTDQSLLLWDSFAQNDTEDITAEQNDCRTVPSFLMRDSIRDKISSLSAKDEEEDHNDQTSDVPLSNFQEEREVFVNNCRIQLLNSIINDEFIDGEVSRTENLVKEMFGRNREAVMSALMDIYLEYFTEQDTHVLKGVLELLSVLPYDEVRPSGQIMALGVMRHKNKYVVKKGIQLYERWNSKEGIKIIKTLHFEETRFQKYAEQVIEYLERDGT